MVLLALLAAFHRAWSLRRVTAPSARVACRPPVGGTRRPADGRRTVPNGPPGKRPDPSQSSEHM